MSESERRLVVLLEDVIRQRLHPLIPIPGSSGEDDTDDSDEEQEYNGPDYSELPDLPIVKIFSYLPDQDKVSLARTSKHFAQMFYSPSLWRKKHFNLNLPGADKAANGFAAVHARSLRHLYLECRHPTILTCKRIQKGLTSFFSKLHGKAVLRTLWMPDFEMERYWRYEYSRERLITSLCRLLRGQKRLRKIDLSGAHLSVFGAFRVLDAMGHGPGRNLSDLNIQDFFHGRLNIFRFTRFNESMSKFTNISQLGISYNYLSDEILEILMHNTKASFKKLTIKVYKNDPHGHRISGIMWHTFKKKFPRLKVHFDIDVIGRRDEIIPLLHPEIPLTDLQIWTGYENEEEWHPVQTFGYIGDNFGHKLENLTLEYDNSIELFDNALVALLKKCRKLVEADLTLTICIPTIERICSMLDGGEFPALKKLFITCCGVSQREWNSLSEIEERYHHLSERGIELDLDTDIFFEDEGNEE